MVCAMLVERHQPNSMSHAVSKSDVSGALNRVQHIYIALVPS